MAFKTLVYSPDVQVLVAAKNGTMDLSSDLVRGTVQRSGDGISFISLTLANKGLRYNNSLRRMDRVIVRMRRIGVWITVFTGYLNTVPALNLYPGTVTVAASCTLKRLKYTYWDSGLPASAALFDQAGTDALNGGDNKDAGMGFMLKNILKEVGGWDEEQIIVQDFPTAFVDYLGKGKEKYANTASDALKKFKELFDYDEATGAATSGTGAGATMGAPTANQEEHTRAIHAASIERNMGVEGTIRACMTGLVESGIRILANEAVPESLNYPHEGMGGDHDSVGIFQQRDNGAWGTLAERMNAQASAGMFLNGMLRLGDWKSRPRGESCQAVQSSAVPDAYAAREADAVALVQRLGLTDTGGQGGGGTGNPVSGLDQAQGTAPGSAPAAAPGAAAPQGRPPTLDRAIGEAKRVGDGRAYVYGGAGPEDFDCSGYMSYIYSLLTNDPNPGSRKFTTEDDFIALGFQEGLGAGFSVGIMRGGGGPNSHMAGTLDGVNIESGGSTNSTNYGGPAVGADHPQFTLHYHLPIVDGAFVSGGGGGGAGAGSTGNSTSNFQNKLAKNLFGYLFDPSTYVKDSSTFYTGEVASVNDEPLLDTVNSICRARMCKFMSAPTGEFLAYYPDYFGLDGTPAKLDLEDIELKNLNIQLNDDNVVTHMFVAGTNLYTAEERAGDLGWLATSGVATVEDAWLFDRLIQASVISPDVTTSAEFLDRFGIRPLKEEYSSIAGKDNPGVELIIAAQRFMQKWAEQSLTNVELTFMPELFPGMRINLIGHDITVYVNAVTHNFDFQSGFSTTASIMAPSKTSAISAPITEGDG